ncbi:MAG: MBL fold metallo-hydrolase [Solirubrobacteraceae bacterium]
MKAFDEDQYVDDRPPLALGGVQSLPVPGKLSLGPDERGHELELHPADGHTGDGTAYFIPWLRTLVCGDYLSPVEIPWLSPGGSVDAYLATLERLRALVERAETIVPGHGRPQPRAEALRLLEEDTAYLRALETDGVDASLPAGRRTHAQRRIHAENVEFVAATRRPS